MNLESLVKDVQVVAVLCNQWGDSGKGKIVDLLAETWADYVLRGTGGNNAGHTVVIGNKTFIFHLLPSGILHDSRGVVNVLGNGMVIDLKVLLDEMETLRRGGGTYNNLQISKDAHVILPWHVNSDQGTKSQAHGGIGSTGRGIGPCYADKIARCGITIGDIFDRDVLAGKLKKLSVHYAGQQISQDEIMQLLQGHGQRIEPFVRDTVAEVHQALAAGKKMLLEGAQGLLLSVEHGTYPYVTSSDCSLNGTASGVGLCAADVDLSLGLMKFPFMTRVGGGPFPTELGGRKSENYCGDDLQNRKAELEKRSIPFTEEKEIIRYDQKHKEIIALINNSDPFLQGVGIRLAAGEYGATTGRLRRVGWTDAVSGKYAARINKYVLVLTKPDALAGADEFKVAVGYRYKGERIGFQRSSTVLRGVDPIYRTYQGYESMQEVRSFDQLPQSLQAAIEDLEHITGAHVGIVSVGPERNQTIVRA